MKLKGIFDVRKILFSVIGGILLFAAVNCRPWGRIPLIYGGAALGIVVLMSILGLVAVKRRLQSVRLSFCAFGYTALIAFLTSTVLSVCYAILNAVKMLPEHWKAWLIGCLVCFLLEAAVFWIGIVCVYCTSFQMGIGLRILGIAVGMIPVANLAVLIRILKASGEEIAFEERKYACNRGRQSERICATRYPVLLVHGVFFRDSKRLNYWGRIPTELERNGAQIFYGNHQSARSVEDSGKEIAARIREIVAETHCEKVHLIAHSKGGLDCRWALAHEGVASMVASLTTVNTPHRGCEFADYLLEKAPQALRDRVAAAYRAAMIRLGDSDPDFLSAVYDLTAHRCRELDASMPLPDGVICHSVGSVLKKARDGQFPLNFSYYLVKHFDGANDGLVGEASFEWGERYTCINPSGGTGISHGDVIDLTRRNLDDFDVREFYVDLVAEWKRRGL